MELVGKRGLKDLESKINHVSGSKMSVWAKNLLMKQGWAEGKGLGKNEDGIKNYVKVKQREESAGLGLEEHDRSKGLESWWYDSFECALRNFKSVGHRSSDSSSSDEDEETMKRVREKDRKQKRERRRRKKERKQAKSREQSGISQQPTDIGGFTVPSFEDLFKATGGKRMGMRARASQKAKWERTERATLSTIHGHLSGQVHAQSGTVQGSKEDEEEERTGGMEEGRKENKREKRGQKEGSGDNAKPKRENKSKNKNAKAVESESKLEKSATRKEKKRKRKGEGATVKTMATITETTIVQGTAAENKCFAGVNEMEVFLQDFTQEKREKRQRKKAAESHEGCLAKRPNKRKRRPSEDISKDTRQPGS